MTDLTDYLLPDRAVAEFGKRIDLGARGDVALRNACRVAVAEELRCLAHGRSMIAPEELVDRADALDPDGAQR